MPARRKRDHAVHTGAQRWLNRKYGDSQLPTAPIDFEFTDTTAAVGTVNTLKVADADGLSTPYAVGSRVEYDGDGVIRTVTAVDATTNTIQFDPALGAPSASGKAVEHYGFGFAESHFDALGVSKIELWTGKTGLPVWQIPATQLPPASAPSLDPPTAVSINVGDAIQFRVAVYDANGKGRWTSVSQILAAGPRFDFDFMLVGAGLTADADIDGLYEATAAGVPTVQARLTLGGVNYDSQVVTVTVT